MDFNLDEDQRMLDDTVRRLLAKDYSLERRAAITASATGMSLELWARFADLGLLGLNVPPEFGGMGGSSLDTMIVMEAFGACLVVEPYVSSCVVGAHVLSASGNRQLAQPLLCALAAGDWRCAMAALEPDSGYDLDAVRSSAAQRDGGWLLSGSKTAVLHGSSADAYIVSARRAGDDQLALFLVSASAPGLQARHFQTIDGQRIAELEFQGLRLPTEALLTPDGDAMAVLEEAIDRGTAALCAEAVGTASRVFDMTLDYVRSRKQFGQEIGRFQAVSHRVAEMQSAIEQARSITLQAHANLRAEPAQRALAVSAAKALAGEAGRFVGEQAVQLHGGIGMTDELAVGRFFKRLTAIDMTWGNADHHVVRFSRGMSGPEGYWAFDERADFVQGTAGAECVQP